MSNKASDRREQWQNRIAEQEKSGQSVRAFCREQGVSEFSFYTWRQRIRKERPVSFALVETAGAVESAGVELLLTTGDRLRIPADAATLRIVLAVVRERA